MAVAACTIGLVTLQSHLIGVSLRKAADKILHTQYITVLTAPSDTPIHLPAGKHRYTFELSLPNSLTETIEFDKQGIAVTHSLFANLHRIGSRWLSNPILRTRRDICVIRVPSADEANAEQTFVVNHSAPGVANIQILLEKATVVMGMVAPVVVKVSARLQGLIFEGLEVNMVEKRSHEKGADTGQARRKEEITEVSLKQRDGTWLKKAELDGTNGEWEGRAEFMVPGCGNGLSPSIKSYPNLIVEHQLQLKLKLTAPAPEEWSEPPGSRVTREFNLRAALRVLSCRAVDDYIALPKYSASGETLDGFHCACSPRYQEFKRSARSLAEIEYEVEEERGLPEYDELEETRT
ncbi:hypothetical protein BC936DRAFT_147161 [Jimgerdemannia flammicorona]|uniref:Arrestin C-terminal-like domain-containing protein n=1 Tax=Jimgerdemannia flammicorona TaxID=994334 RepID=A0A433D5Y1_9FUNG|nr:hypothetical protein BC936DRAFT_147161 [Jimgerdemannia flammicorona]